MKIKSYAAHNAGDALVPYEYETGPLAAEEVLVEVDYCGVCHSDLSMIDNEWGISSYPVIAGHDVIGRISALGDAAQDKGSARGYRLDREKLPAL